MASPSSSGSRRRSTNRQNSVEDQALSQIHSEAESRLAIRRAARAEARDIRTRELERQKLEEEEKEKEKEKEGKVDRITDLKKDYTGSRFLSNGSRRGSSDSGDDRDLRKELYELEEKYKKAMMNNAQLDNEKVALRYQVDLLRDQVEDLAEHMTETQREFKEKSRELELKKRDYSDLDEKFKACELLLRQRDELIKEHGLMFVNDTTLLERQAAESASSSSSSSSGEESSSGAGKKDAGKLTGTASAALLTPEAVEILDAYSGTLSERLRKLGSDKRAIEKELKKLKSELEEERERRSVVDKYATSHSPHGTPVSNGPTDARTTDSDLQKQLSEYKLKLKRAEQEITTLEGNVVRLESQVKRFRTTAENLERSEEELKSEKRKFQKELREALAAKEELQMENGHLQKRLDKAMKSRGTSAK